MRYGIFSDIHSNLEAFESVLAAYRDERIDKYLCVGDIVGYATDAGECIKKIQELSCISVMGNHDAASVGLMDTEYFNPVAKAAVFWTQERLNKEEKHFLGSLKYVYENEDLILVHGTLNNPERFDYLFSITLAVQTFSLMERQVCFIGHTHSPTIFVQDNHKISYLDEFNVEIFKGKKYIINVGSVGQPRDGDPKAAHCIYDTDSHLIEIKRIEYNIALTQQRIIQAGLPTSLAARLSRGL